MHRSSKLGLLGDRLIQKIRQCFKTDIILTDYLVKNHILALL